MKAIVINLLKSFLLSKGKLFLCIAAAVLSTWGISTVFYSYFLTTRDFEENFAKTNPADIILTLSDPTDSLINAIGSLSTVSQMERRETITGRVRNVNGNWMSLVLFASDSLENTRISKFELAETFGKIRSGIFIERNGTSFLDSQADSIIIQFPGFDATTIAWSGNVYDPGQAPSQMEQTLYGYTSIKNIFQFKANNAKRFLITTKKPHLNEFELRIIANEIVIMATKSKTKAVFTIPPPGQHPHQGIVDGISFLQKSFGMILSMLGVVLLSLIIITWLYPQIVNIGIMKAIGASTPMIFKAYVLVLTSILFIGLAIGLPFGYKSAELYNKAIAFIQNFNPITDGLPLQLHLFVSLPALLVPMVFAIIPLTKAVRTTVHDALNHIFYTPYQAVFRMTQTSLNNVVWKYSVNNLFRSNQRTSLMMLLLIVGVALFTTGSNLRYSLKKDFASYANDSGYEVTITLKDSSTRPLDFLKKLSFVDALTYVNIKGVRFKVGTQSFDENSSLRTMSPDYEFNGERISEGTYKRECGDCIYISQRYRSDFEKLSFGDTVELQLGNSVRSFIYSGIVKDIMHPGFYRFGSEQNYSFLEVAVKLKRGVSSVEAVKEIDDALLEHDIDVRSVSEETTRLTALENHLRPMYLVVQVMGGVTIAIAVIGLMIVLNLALQERAREIGIMKALGANIKSIVNTYHREYLILSTTSIVIGLFVAYLFTVAICNLFGVMVINAPVPPLNDFLSIGVLALSLLSIQSIIISVYVRFKISNSSAKLLTEVV
jgi:putative ABC transport system permease protein